MEKLLVTSQLSKKGCQRKKRVELIRRRSLTQGCSGVNRHVRHCGSALVPGVLAHAYYK